ncbi:MAG: phosphoadenosine phosphosulfate reductase [Firmicutes bacterium]|nr:phosphoadenosine phosphosulfate reductase [Bacillota bacterium]
MGQQIWTEAELSEVALSLEGQSPEAALRWAFQHFAQDDIALACSFGAEDVALVHMMTGIRPAARAFYLDTNVLFPETYGLIEQIKAKYDVTLEQYLPLLTLEQQAAMHGDALWSREPDSCCGIRKVEPLERALSGLKAWITGIRREQSPTRANARPVEWDRKFGLVKVNPLVAWSEKDLWQYISDHSVPYNSLHDQGYPSIGCTHCTRAVMPGEDPRSGRWSGFTKTECGLHK